MAVVLGLAGLATAYTHALFGAAILFLSTLFAVCCVASDRVGPQVGIWTVIVIAVGVRLVIVTDRARADAATWSEMAASGGEAQVLATVRLTSVLPSGDQRWYLRGEALGCSLRPCRGATLRWSWAGEHAPKVGEQWSLSGRLRAEPLRVHRRGGYPPPGLVRQRRRGTLTESEAIERSSARVPLLETSEQHLRDRIAARFGVRLAPLVTALLLGDRTQLPPALVDAFGAAGALHLLAVSGLHVGFLAWLLALGLGLVGWGPVRRASMASLVLFAYAMLVGGRPSVIRAATMTAALLWARATERRVSVWQVWGLAAVAMLAWRPLDLFDLGFALSFGAVAGLLIWGRGAGRALQAGRSLNVLALIQRGIVASVVATGAAGLGTLPVQSTAFGWVAPAGFLVNPVAVPLAAIGLPLAWLALIADALGLRLLAEPLAATASLALGVLEAAVVGVASRFSVWVPSPGAWAIVLVTGLIAAAVLVARNRSLAGWGVAAVIVALSLGGHRQPNNSLELTWLDVGQGDAVVIRFPDGAAWLVDAGPAYPNGDAGRSVVLPYLRTHGIDRLEWLISTHPDLDHVGGAVSVVDGVRVDRWGSPAALGDNPAYIRLLATVGNHTTTKAVQLRADDHLRQGAAKVDVLHPRDDWVPSDPYESATTANDASIVLLISYAGCRALLSGDIGERAETALTTALGDSLRAGLLHVGHHGSRHSTTLRWLARVKPTAAVVSVSALNRHGHPHVEVLERLERADVDVYRTDRLGTITARCVSGGWRVESATLYLR